MGQPPRTCHTEFLSGSTYLGLGPPTLAVGGWVEQGKRKQAKQGLTTRANSSCMTTPSAHTLTRTNCSPEAYLPVNFDYRSYFAKKLVNESVAVGMFSGGGGGVLSFTPKPEFIPLSPQSSLNLPLVLSFSLICCSSSDAGHDG